MEPGTKTVHHYPSQYDRSFTERTVGSPAGSPSLRAAWCPGIGKADPHGRRDADMTAPRPAAPPAHAAMFAALAVPNFRRYVSGQSLSLIGTWVETVAQALLVLRLTHSGIVLGLTTAARYAPILLLSPYAGLLVDRYAKRRVLLGTQAGLGLVSAALGAAVLTGEIR